MGKANPATSKQPPNSHLFARLSHLYKAATTLTTPTTSNKAQSDLSTTNLSRFYLNHLRSVAKKSVIRLDPSIKRTICKRCDALLIPGVSCEHRIENKSKNGKKPWADVLIIECKACRAVKRFPVGIDERKAKKGKVSKPQNEGGDVGQQLDRGGLDRKTGRKKGGGLDARVFKMSDTLASEKLANTVGVRDATEEKLEAHVIEALSDVVDVQMNNVSTANQA
jgi:ribonuclease P protein subunit RPR2